MAIVSATPRAKKPSATPLMWQYWKQGTVAAVVLVLAVIYPYAGGLIAKRMISRKVAARTSLVMTIGSARAGLTQVTFFDVSLTDNPDVQIHVARITVPVRAVWGGGTVWLEAPELKASSIAALKKVRTRSTSAATSPSAARTGPSLGFAHGRVLIGAPDAKVFWADQITGSVAPNAAATVTLANLEGHAAGILGGKGLQVGGFGARKLHLSLPLSGMRVAGLPSVTVADGFVQALPALGLSGISGQIAPKSKGAGRDGASILMFSGSYGGAQERLWNAVGEFRLGKSWQDSEGTFGLRAERFMLDRIKNVLPPTV